MAEIKQHIVLGSGGHAKVLIQVLKVIGVPVWGCTSRMQADHGKDILGVSVKGGDALLDKLDPEDFLLVNGLGTVKIDSPSPQVKIFEDWKARGFSFATIVHPSATIAEDAVLGEGVQIMAGCILQPGTTVGKNSIINTSASLDHDCEIGSHVHIASGVTLSGGVRVGDGSFIGCGASVIQYKNIGRGVLVGAGAVVIRDVPDAVKVLGVPGKVVQ